MRLLAIPLFCLGMLTQQAAIAGPSTDALMTCVKDNTTGKDRKDVARWMFLAMSAHPDMASLSTASAAARTESNKSLASLAMRLLAENCSSQARAAVQQDGDRQALTAAFGALGEVAMMELMQHPNVDAAVTGYTEHLDISRLEKAFGK